MYKSVYVWMQTHIHVFKCINALLFCRYLTSKATATGAGTNSVLKLLI